MKRVHYIAWLILPLSFLRPTSAQQPVTVQLPTFSYFTVNTSVLVPDGGGAYLGGVSRARSGSTYRGTPLAGKTPFLSPLLSNRATSHAVGGGPMSVHATIIDHGEIDERILGAALAQRGSQPAGTADGAAGGPPVVAAAADNSPAAAVASVAEIRRKQSAADELQQAEARQYFEKAAAYEAAQQPGLAKIHFRMAASRAQGELKTEAQQRLRALEQAPQGKASAGR